MKQEPTGGAEAEGLTFRRMSESSACLIAL